MHSQNSLKQSQVDLFHESTNSTHLESDSHQSDQTFQQEYALLLGYLYQNNPGAKAPLSETTSASVNTTVNFVFYRGPRTAAVGIF